MSMARTNLALRYDLLDADPVHDAQVELLWTELEGIAKAIAERVAEQIVEPAGEEWNSIGIHLRMTGASYSARFKVLAQAPERTVVLVAVEPRISFMAHPDDLCVRFRLTPTEARVALMLAERMTNREIASSLFVSEHTARRHTEKVLLRLGVRRRTAVREVLETTLAKS